MKANDRKSAEALVKTVAGKRPDTNGDVTPTPDELGAYSKMDSDLQAIAKANNVRLDQVAILQTGTVSGITYFYDLASEAVYFSWDGAITGTISALTVTDENHAVVTVDAVDYDLISVEWKNWRDVGDVRGWGVVGFGDETDNFESAVNYLCTSGRTLNLRDLEISISRELSFSTSRNIEFIGYGAKITSNLTTHTQKFITFKLTECDLIWGSVEIDVNKKSNVGLSIESNDDVESPLVSPSSFEFRGIIRNTYRIIDFIRGAGLHVQGGFLKVKLDGEIYDSTQAENASVPGVQAIRGALVGANRGTTEYPINIVVGDNSIIDNVSSDDLDSLNDQDGLYVFSPLVKRTNSNLTVNKGAIFRNCRGRSIKSKLDYNDVSGIYQYSKGNASGNIGVIIDLQYGGVISTPTIIAEGVSINSVLGFGGVEYTSSEAASKAIVNGLNVYSDTLIDKIITMYPRGAYSGDLTVTSATIKSDVMNFLSSSVNGGDRQTNITNVNIDNLKGNLIACYASGGDSPYSATFNVSNCINKGSDNPDVCIHRISGRSATAYVNASNLQGFASSSEVFRVTQLGVDTPAAYSQLMTPITAPFIGIDNDLKTLGGGFYGESITLTESAEFTFTARGRRGVSNGIYFAIVASSTGGQYLAMFAVSGTSIINLNGGIGSLFSFSSTGDSNSESSAINVWVDGSTGSIKMQSELSGASRSITLWSLS